MKISDFFNRRSRYLLVAFGILLVSLLLISIVVVNNRKPENITARLTKEVKVSQQKLSAEVGSILSELLKREKSFNLFLQNHFAEHFNEKGEIFLIYRNGKLTYWTDNTFPAPETYDSVLFTPQAINFGNGWYLAVKKETPEYCVIGLQLLKYGYKYHNDYLPDSFLGEFSIPGNTIISASPGKETVQQYKIASSEGKPLFFISFSGMPRPGPWVIPVLFILVSLCLIILIAFVFELYKEVYKKLNSKWLLLAFYIDVLIIRAIQFYFSLPSLLYESDLFSPIFYASSEWLPSLGDFFINMIIALEVSWLTFNGMGKSRNYIKPNNIYRYISLIGGTLLILLLFHAMNILFRGLVINSSIPFGFDGIFRISLLSLTGYTIIAALLFTFLFFFLSLCRWLIGYGNSAKSFLIAGISGSLLYFIFLITERNFNAYYSLIILVVFIIFYFQHREGKIERIKLSQTVLYVFILAILANFSLNLYNRHHELEKRKLMALHLTEYRDSMAEYKFGKVSNEILLDNNVVQALKSFQSNPEAEQDIIKYLMNNHFNGYWSKFRLQITLCYSGKKLQIKPDNSIVECCDYFDDEIMKNGKQTSVSGLYFFDNALDMMYYTGRIALTPEITGLKTPYFLYVEIISKNNFFSTGYPQLLLDKKSADPAFLYDYSYAIYNKGELIKSAGSYAYDLHMFGKKGISGTDANFNYNSYNHQLFPINNMAQLVISHRNLSPAESIAPFSYIFLFLSVFMLFFHLLSAKQLSLKQLNLTFRVRLQAALVAIILASSVVIGTVTILNLIRLSETKNMEIVREKMNSVRYELEMLLSEYQQLNTDDEICCPMPSTVLPMHCLLM